MIKLTLLADSMEELLSHHFYKLGTLQILNGVSIDYIVADKIQEIGISC
jgi:hypothetical protein